MKKQLGKQRNQSIVLIQIQYLALREPQKYTALAW